MINGPESFTPDGNFTRRGARCANMFVGAGFNAFGIAAGGGAGWVLAHWAATGEAPMDLWVVDIRRFSALHRDRDWVRDRTLEAYGKHYNRLPARGIRKRPQPHRLPLYARLKAHGAVFGLKLGWERPNCAGRRRAAGYLFDGPQNWFGPVGEEHRLVREAVGLFDQSSFAKYSWPGGAPPRSTGSRRTCRQAGGPADLRNCSTRAAASNAT